MSTALADVPISTVAQVASQYSIPPAILQAVLRQGDIGAGATSAGIPTASLESMGIDASMQNDPTVMVEMAASRLSQSFNQYGDWQQAVSYYLTGNAQDYLSPTSAVGGTVWSILGAASADPTAGMQGFAPSNSTLFNSAASGFTNVLQEVHSAGGVVTQQHINDWHETSSAVGGSFGNAAMGQALQAAAKNHDQSYSFGQCTYYVARSLGWIPGGLGNASDWASRAANKGFNVSHTPAVGTAVVYGANSGGAGGYGHVAVVTAVNPDGTFTVSEMNVDGNNVADTRHSTMAGVIGFIQPPPGTDMATAAPGLKATVAATAKPPAPGTKPTVTGLPDAPKPKGPAPSEVQQFAQQLQGAGIHPNDFAQNFPSFAASRRRLMQLNSTPGDYAQAVNALQQHNQPVTEANINAFLANQPHPTYSDLTVGQYQAAHSQALLHSVPLLGRTPYPAEVSRLAASGANWTQTQQFYNSMAPQQDKQAATNDAQGNPPQKQGGPR